MVTKSVFGLTAHCRPRTQRSMHAATPALCGTALGAGDYLALATRYHTLILERIPRLSPSNYDKARRFIVLIDTLYDHQVKLFASADATQDQLYLHGENARMFERTVSRLDEMQSLHWLELPHLA